MKLVLPNRSNSNSPSTGAMTMPCRPSKPPVMFGEAVGELAQQQRDAERHHQPRQVGAAHDEKRGDEAEHHGGKARDQQRQHRLVDDVMQRQQARRIGADAEERRVAERDDAGIAQDQIEREHEQREPGDLGQDQVAVREQQDRHQRQRPEQHLAPAPAREVGDAGSDAGAVAPGHVSASRFGRTDRSDAGSGSRSSWCRSRMRRVSARNTCRRRRRCRAAATPGRAR